MPVTSSPSCPRQAGRCQDHSLLPEAQEEILNVLRAIGTIPGEPAPADQVVVDTVAHVRAPLGGLFRPVVGFDGVGGFVSGGDLLGTIASAFSGETLAEVRAPFVESWLMMVRGRLSRVHPGDPLYIIGREKGRVVMPWRRREDLSRRDLA